MTKETNYTEEELIDMVQSGKCGWLEYVCKCSREMHDEFMEFCRVRECEPNDELALRYLDMKQAQFDEAMEYGDA
jgi:hypothetical protein